MIMSFILSPCFHAIPNFYLPSLPHEEPHAEGIPFPSSSAPQADGFGLLLSSSAPQADGFGFSSPSWEPQVDPQPEGI